MEEMFEGIERDNCALRIVSPAYAGREGELTAILQYVFQAITLQSGGMSEEGKTLMKISCDEMRHFEWLGTLISKLGAPPVFTACPPYPVGYYSASCVNYAKNIQAMLEADIRGERAAIAQYERMLYQLENEKARKIIEKITAEERGHLALLEEMLARLS